MEKKNLMKVKDLKKAAKVELSTIEGNPTYLMRKLNKVCQGKGKDTDLKEVEGLNIQKMKDLYNRLNDTFGCGGYWWGSIFAVNGKLVTNVKPVKPYAIYNNSEKLIRYCGQLYYATFATKWTRSAIMDSAAAKLAIIESIAAAFDKEDQKEARKAENKEARKARKEKQQKANNLAAKVAELKAKVASGEITESEAAAALFAA